MAQAKYGDTVKVDYKGKFDDGTVFENTINHDPIQFVIGEGERISGFEQTMVGMNPGDWKTTKIPADEAHGPHYEEMVLVVNGNQFPGHMELKVDQQLQVRQADGRLCFVVTVTDVSDSSVTLDCNHPLAGKDLTFDIQLIEII
jgi:FKBP-type peptidyl-prolyl cis-trans isomerase 2